MIGLKGLVQQMEEVRVRKKATVAPICPRCKERPRARTEMGGALKDYCKECNRVIANERNAKYRKPKESSYA